VNCRLALPYTRNGAALSEMARVLRPGGLLLLKIHHARFYLDRAWLALRSGRLRPAASAFRVLLAGALYHLTFRQPQSRFLAREVFQTRWLLQRILSAVGLAIRRELRNSDSNPRTPIFVIEKVDRLKPGPAPLEAEAVLPGKS
jgi:hypothetical protein